MCKNVCRFLAPPQYHDGSLFGKWFDLSNYSDSKAFYKDCYEYHRNEFLPEVMFQDWEYIPDFLISESWLHEDTFRYFEITDEMDQERAEAFEIYCSSIVSWPSNGNDLEETLQGFEESYQGYFSGSMKDPETEFAYQYIEDTGMLSDVPELLQSILIMKPLQGIYFWKGIVNMMVMFSQTIELSFKEPDKSYLQAL
jgi:antirestriction protein